MASDVEIANAALREVGAATITAFTDDSEEGRIVNATYGNIRDEMLQLHPWNFAIARQSISANAATPDWEFAFSYDFPSAPNYCLRVWEVSGEDLDSGKWKVEGRKILTDLPISTDSGGLPIRFSKRVVDPEQFTPLFRAAFEYRLAMRWAEQLTGRSAIRDRMEASYEKALPEARSADGAEGTPDKLQANEWLDSRN